MTVLEARISIALIGVALLAFGGAAALNFRGFNRWLARQSVEMTPSWPFRPEPNLERRRRVQIVMGHIAGTVFAIVGVVMVLMAAFGHFTRTGS